MGFTRTGIAKASAAVKIGYSDFIRLCNVRDADDWLPGLRVAFDGVWVQEQSAHLDHLEHSILTAHPDGDPSRPVVTFPCTIAELESRIVDFYGNNGFIDPFELAEFAAVELQKVGNTSFSNGPSCADDPSPGRNVAATRERNNLLRVIAVLLKVGNIPIEERKGGVGIVVRAIEENGLDGPKQATVQKIFADVRELLAS